MTSPIYLTDAYKLGHVHMMPKGTTHIYSNWTPRSTRIPDYDKVTFLGLQYFLDRFMMRDFEKFFFSQPREKVLKEYGDFLAGFLGPDNANVDHIAALHDIGYVPLQFFALPEGSRSPIRVPMLVVDNTHPDFCWLPNFFETLISTSIWMACTSATTAFYLRALLDRYAKETDGDLNVVPWQAHDFSMRGMSSCEAGMLSGMGHLTSFFGTDTVSAVRFIENYYPGPAVLAGSVPASEHSVASCYGPDSELEAYSELLDRFTKGIISLVSDTYDLFGVLTKVLPALKEKILARDGKLVIRPDSGIPELILCGNPNAATDSPERKGVIELLWDEFGGSVSERGYRTLNPHIGAIYGDAITYERAEKICQRLKAKNFVSTNVIYGVGSLTYQLKTRDTFGFAMKATAAVVNGEHRDLFKDPKTDSGEKRSARGRLAVLKNEAGELYVVEKATPEQEAQSELKLVWKDGVFHRRHTFQEIRDRVASYRNQGG